MGEKLVGMVKLVAEELSVDLSEVGSSFPSMEEVEEAPLHHLPVASSHGLLRILLRVTLKFGVCL